MSLIQYDWFAYKKRKIPCEDDAHRRECHVTMKTENDMLQFQAKEF